MSIHPSAIFEELDVNGTKQKAELGKDVTVGPYAVIGPWAKIADGCSVGAHAVIAGRTTLQAGVKVSPHAVVGGEPQDLKYHGEPGELEVGAGTRIREFATLHIGTEGGGMKTVVGKNCLLMAYSHVAHDCVVGDRVILANCATLAGHVEVGSFAIVGGLAAVHQFTRVGRNAFLSGGTMVTHDITPFCVAQGDRAGLVGLNTEGLKRAGFDTDTIGALKKAYRIIFRSKKGLEEALGEIESEDMKPEVQELVDFARACKRGLARHRSSGG
jgi:UDP-N-acetylglucosamine acyltransferase